MALKDWQPIIIDRNLITYQRIGSLLALSLGKVGNHWEVQEQQVMVRHPSYKDLKSFKTKSKASAYAKKYMETH